MGKEIMEWVVDQAKNHSESGSWIVYYEEIEDEFGIDLRFAPELAYEIWYLLSKNPAVSQIEPLKGAYDFVLFTDELLAYSE